MHNDIRRIRQRVDSMATQKQDGTSKPPSNEVSNAGLLSSQIISDGPEVSIQHPRSSAHTRMDPPSRVANTTGTLSRPRMGMTRENSPDLPGGEEHVQLPVSVTEPMGSLYEVTRLRNIRSNQAETARHETNRTDSPEDFISRGVRTHSLHTQTSAELSQTNRSLVQQKPRNSTRCK